VRDVEKNIVSRGSKTGLSCSRRQKRGGEIGRAPLEVYAGERAVIFAKERDSKEDGGPKRDKNKVPSGQGIGDEVCGLEREGQPPEG